MLIFYRNGVQIGDILEQETEEFESRVFTLNGRKTKPKWLKEKKHFGSYNWQRIGLVAGLAGSRVLTPPSNTNTSHTPFISWLFSSVTSPLPVRIPPHGGGGQLQNSSSSENKTQQRERFVSPFYLAKVPWLYLIGQLKFYVHLRISHYDHM